MTPFIAVAGRNGAPSRVSRDAVSFAGKRYLNSILRAGGEPVIITPQTFHDDGALRLMERFDALVLMGGADVDPALYGQTASPQVYGVSPEQDHFESSLFFAAIELGLPVLAVCRGMQLSNVLLGGSLVQHLADLPNAGDLLQHAPGEFPVGAEFVTHDVTLDTGSFLAESMGSTTISGASFHHQVVDKLGDGFRVVGRAEDGLVEAIEHERHRIIGVQWHPEDTSAHDPQQQALYAGFVGMAQRTTRVTA